MPYQYEIIQEICDISDNIYELELLLKRYYKDIQYYPQIPFCGSVTECFK